MPNEIDKIPREDLIQMLKESCWFSGNREGLPINAYSLDVNEEACYRDVVYRNAPVFPTAEEAIVGHWKKHYTE